MQTKVVKFGGSSLADAEHFRQVADIIRADSSRRFVVPSAPGKRFEGDTKVTDMLYRCYEMIKNREDADAYYGQIRERYNRIIRELGMNYDISGELQYVMGAMCHASGRDYAASRGEYLCGLILAKYLGYDFVDAENVIFFRENGTFDEERTNEALSRELARHAHAVIPGFYGAMPNGTVKTFSRGGSDITGSIVARAVDADLYENWTDVSGFLMADPRVVKDPPTIETITYRELRELSYMGASVLHDESIFPVRYAGIPINIRNTNRPDDPGTMIVPSAAGYDARHVITGVAGKRGFSVINIEKDMMNAEVGFGRKVLEILEDQDISFEHLPSGIDTMSIITGTAALEGKRERILRSINNTVRADHIEILDGLSLIAVVGRGMVKARGTAARIFGAVSAAGVNIRMIDQGSSELNIILGVDEDAYETTLRAIFEEFVK
ncbi:MAG: aspartate kinase [Clostridia bacterium]|nr:aspartate kinase [Clostridia bacterium]MDD7700428.1 aspartate kinase [Eubacteriales bacterium]MDY2827308.1 aspartate kinase [Eubacteriales bacterium]